MKSPTFLALDLDSPKEALDLAQKVLPYVGGFKIGPRLAFRGGPELTRSLAKLAPLFIDFKFFDIPSTMVAAVEACAEVGAHYVTVHAAAGPTALEALQKIKSVKILAVTVLTSFTQETLPNFLRQIPIAQQVEELARLTIESGIQGLVCSPHEVKNLRQKFSQSFLVTPGIRLDEDQKNDQSRTLTPQQAMAEGASCLVIGRPILSAADPVAKAKMIFESLK